MKRSRILLFIAALILPRCASFISSTAVTKWESIPLTKRRAVRSRSSKERAVVSTSSVAQPRQRISYNSTLLVSAARSSPADAHRNSLRQLDNSYADDETNEATSKSIMLLLLWSIACLSALDRVAMSVAILPMSVDLGWSDTTKGAVSSLFSVGYGLCIVPAGLMVSWQSPTRVLAVGVGVWSMATMLTPHAAVLPGMMALLLVRAAVGAGESVIMPSLQTLLLNWTSPQEKSRALAWIYSGFHVGTISAYVTSPIIMSEVGWTGLFEVYGAAGLLILIPWLMYARDGPAFVGPPANSVTNIKVNNVPQQQMQQSIAALQEAPWRDFLQSKGAWAMLLAHCAKNWGLYTSLAWTPTFFAEQYHLDAKESALFSVLPSVVGAIGGIVAGTLVDSLISEDDGVGSRTRLRKIFQCIAFLGPALALGTLALSIPEEPWLAQVFLVISIGLQSFNTAGFEAGTQEKAGQRWAGLLYSWTSLPAVVVGTSGVYVAGRILDATGQDWSMVFGLNAIVNVIGALAFVSLYDAKREFD